MAKECHSLNTNNQNKPKMVWFLKFEFLFALKLNFYGGPFKKNLSKFGYFKKWKKVKIKMFEVALLSICVIKFEVENLEHLHWKVWGWKFWYKFNKSGIERFQIWICTL